jgi:hypothetical protein
LAVVAVALIRWLVSQEVLVVAVLEAQQTELVMREVLAHQDKALQVVLV